MPLVASFAKPQNPRNRSGDKAASGFSNPNGPAAPFALTPQQLRNFMKELRNGGYTANAAAAAKIQDKFRPIRGQNGSPRPPVAANNAKPALMPSQQLAQDPNQSPAQPLQDLQQNPAFSGQQLLSPAVFLRRTNVEALDLNPAAQPRRTFGQDDPNSELVNANTFERLLMKELGINLAQAREIEDRMEERLHCQLFDKSERSFGHDDLVPEPKHTHLQIEHAFEPAIKEAAKTMEHSNSPLKAVGDFIDNFAHQLAGTAAKTEARQTAGTVGKASGAVTQATPRINPKPIGPTNIA